MPPKDPEKRRQQTREAVRRHRVRNGSTVDKLVEQVQKAADLPDPPSRDFLIRALGVQAMQGNVPAIRLLLEEYRRDADSDKDNEPADPLGEFDELADRRGRRAS